MKDPVRRPRVNPRSKTLICLRARLFKRIPVFEIFFAADRMRYDLIDQANKGQISDEQAEALVKDAGLEPLATIRIDRSLIRWSEVGGPS